MTRKIREQDEDWLLGNYNKLSQKECAKQLDVSVRTVARWAESLGLRKTRGRRANADKVEDTKSTTLYRKDSRVKKCCYLCSEFPSCENQKGENPYRLVCWDFKLKKELAV